MINYALATHQSTYSRKGGIRMFHWNVKKSSRQSTKDIFKFIGLPCVIQNNSSSIYENNRNYAHWMI